MIELTKEDISDLLIERIAYYGIDKDIRSQILDHIDDDDEELYTFACDIYERGCLTKDI